jgi:dethiobiotin synthetase
MYFLYEVKGNFHMKKQFTVIAPDTECGKTFATAMLLKNAIVANINAIACKPIQTGSVNGKSQDLDFIFKMAGIIVDDSVYSSLVPCVLETPASALLASRLEKQRINLDEISQKVRKVSQDYDLFFAETAGGIYSPITQNETTADLAKKLGFPVIICIPNRIGAISLGIMAVKSALAEGLTIEGAVFSQTVKPQNESDTLVCKDNVETFRNITGVKIIADYKFEE